MKVSRSQRRRGRVVLAVFLAASVIAPAGTAGAQSRPPPPPPRDLEPACPSGRVPADGFADVAGNVHRRAIGCIAWYGITGGTTATTYGPASAVPREQMASFIARLIDHASDSDPRAPRLPAFDGANDFPCDVSPTGAGGRPNPHFDNIQRLAQAGIAVGAPAGLPRSCYGPGLGVTRAQMATFLNRAQRFLGVEITEGPGAIFADYFVDDDRSPHERNVNAITSAGIAQGIGGARYGPESNVRRDQMASFVARTLARLVAIDDAILDVDPPP